MAEGSGIGVMGALGAMGTAEAVGAKGAVGTSGVVRTVGATEAMGAAAATGAEAATAGLSERQRRLLELMQLERRQAARGAAPAAIPRRLAGAAPVLSFGQQRLWFMEQLQPGSAAYHVPGAVRIRGALDVGVLARCLAEVARRHEILRTGFVVRDGEPAPAIAAEPALRLTVTDLSGLPAAGREREAARVVGAQVERPFDLTRPPLARTGLVRLGGEEWIFLLVLQHIVSDIWSVGVFFRNAMALYDAFTAGLPSPLPELPVQYSDYAAWQQQVLQGASLRALLDYWQEQVAGAPLAIDLPADHPRPAMQSFTGGRRYMTFSLGLAARLKAVAKEQEASLYMILLAALDALLHRLTGARTVLVGVPMANRNRLELEGLIGLLFNSLVLRADLDGRMPLRALLAQVRERLLGAMQHQDLPFERLVEALRVERDMSRNPVYQVLFAFQNVPPSAMAARGLSLARYEVAESTSREDLELDLRETPQGLAGWFGYDQALFDPATVERIAGQFGCLLAGIAETPDRPLGELPLLTAAEAQALRYEWNDTAEGEGGGEGGEGEGAGGSGAGFLDLLAAQVARTPDQVAAADPERTITYRELAERVAEIAQALAEAGVRRGGLVAILAPRSVKFLEIVLGVLAAGAAYLPLDPEHPPRRQAQILAQARAALVVAAGETGDWGEETPRVVRPGDLSISRAPAAGPPGACGSAGPGPLDLAYVIFTSGSTGLPKGAAIAHGGMVNHLFAKIADLGLGPRDVVAQTASQCFDISVWQMLAALAVGGRVRILPDEVAHDPARLLDAAEAAGITVLETVPSLLRLLIDEARRRGAARPALAALRWMVPTGEALPPGLCAEWLELYPRVPLLNAYGPTECSDDVTHQPIARPPGAMSAPASASASVPIGRPLRNTRLMVADAELRLAPAGVTGELCVGGEGVGRGYLHDPERTALAFVPDPFADGSAWGGAAGARLYRTGDLARRRSDGSIDFLGRIDHQVKVRGFRIELGEIESVLAEVPGVRQAAVLARSAGSGAGAQTLIAHWTAADAEAAASERAAVERQARAHLAERLPEYMVPAVFVWHAEIPLTPNGKLDRRALAVIGGNGGSGAAGAVAAGGTAAGGAGFVAPRNPVEESLAGIWAEVLKVPAVPGIGVYDDFFAAGGQSLLATQVVTRVREAFGVDLPVRALFQKPTVAGLAESLEVALLNRRGLPPAPPMTRIPEAERGGPLAPSFGQERFWFIDQLRPGMTAYNIFGAVRMRGRLDAAVLSASFDELLRRHEVLRTTFAAADGKPVQVIGPPRRFPLATVDLRGLPAAARDQAGERLKNVEAERPFDLARGPLIRGLLLRLGERDAVLAVTAHHIVYDVWSRELLIRELGALYAALWHRRPSPLPELPIQYADFAHWQRRWLAGGVIAAQLDFWKGQLAGVTAGSELPGDRPRPPVQSFRGRRQLLAIAPAATVALKELSRGAGATLFMTLLAGFAALLGAHTGEDDIVVGSPIANRNRAETEALIGFFVNTQVLRTRLDGGPSLRQAIGRVRETALAAYAHQDLAFEQLVGALRPGRDTARQPLFQILFNFLTNYQPVALELPELTLTPEANHSGAVQFDLILSIYEAAGELHVSADYATDLFDGATVARILRHYAALLAAGAAAPEAPLEALSWLPAGERQQLLHDWAEGPPGGGSDGWADGPAAGEEALIHELILAQAARAPGAPAVAGADGTQVLTYGDLAAWAGRLASALRRRGVGPEVLVGVRIASGPEAVVAILAVLMAGGGYVPLDPAYPAERLDLMAEDAGVRLVLAAGSEAEMTGDLGVAAAPGVQAARPLPEHPAYVIYTSGSTGRPKGVMVSHRALLCSTRARFTAYRAPVAAFLLLPSLAFDSSVAVVFWTLCQGGCLVIPEAERRADPAHLAGLVARHRVSHWLSIPRLYALALAHARTDDGAAVPPRGLATLRQVIVAGEACPAELVAAHRALVPTAGLHNEYGPTESTVWATVGAWDARAPGDALPIGRPIAGARVRLLDDRGGRSGDGRPVPAGAAAELLLGGAGLARGYHRQPGLTAERFVPDPLAGTAAEPGARLYRTGDLARWLPDGRLDLLGRADRQVKVRGVRIEPGEIEAALQRHPAIREAAVLVKEVLPGDRRLVAFFAADEAAAPDKAADKAAPDKSAGEAAALDPAALRAFLAASLPDSMVPSAFVRRDALPLTPAGKIDRRALAEIDVRGAAAAERDVAYVAPRSPLEERLAAIWQELLGVPRVGARDNFFDLGGHSLLTTQLMSRLRAAFQLDVPLPAFFEDPTVAGLAQAIELARWAEEVAREAPAAGAAAMAAVAAGFREPGEPGDLEEGEL